MCVGLRRSDRTSDWGQGLASPAPRLERAQRCFAHDDDEGQRDRRDWGRRPTIFYLVEPADPCGCRSRIGGAPQLHSYRLPRLAHFLKVHESRQTPRRPPSILENMSGMAPSRRRGLAEHVATVCALSDRDQPNRASASCPPVALLSHLAPSGRFIYYKLERRAADLRGGRGTVDVTVGLICLGE